MEPCIAAPSIAADAAASGILNDSAIDVAAALAAGMRAEKPADESELEDADTDGVVDAAEEASDNPAAANPGGVSIAYLQPRKHVSFENKIETMNVIMQNE